MNVFNIILSPFAYIGGLSVDHGPITVTIVLMIPGIIALAVVEIVPVVLAL